MSPPCAASIDAARARPAGLHGDACVVRIRHVASNAFMACERTASLRHGAWEQYTHFRLSVSDSRLADCWHPLERRWLRLGFLAAPKWTLTASPVEVDLTPLQQVLVVAANRTARNLSCAAAAVQPVWLAHRSGVLIGINRRPGTPPALRGHTSARTVIKGAALCREEGTLFEVHPFLPSHALVSTNDDAGAGAKSLHAMARARSGALATSAFAASSLPSGVRAPPSLATAACYARMGDRCSSTVTSYVHAAAAPLRLLAGVLSHGRGLTTRGVPILRTWGRTIEAHVLAEHGEEAIRRLVEQRCVRWHAADQRDRHYGLQKREEGKGTSRSLKGGGGGGVGEGGGDGEGREDGADGELGLGVTESWRCDDDYSSTKKDEDEHEASVPSKRAHAVHGQRRVGSRAVLVRGCGGSESAGCCRVTRWLGSVVLSKAALSHVGKRAHLRSHRPFDWLLIVDDDVFVRPDIACVLGGLNASERLFLPAKHAHDAAWDCDRGGGAGGSGFGAARQLLDCNRVSLCGEVGPLHLRSTLLSLPAGFGALSWGFARLLANGWASHRLRKQCSAHGWYYDLALSFASWALGIDLVPALDWTRKSASVWSGGQHWLWSARSVINHKADTEYDFDELLHTCAFDTEAMPPDRSQLHPLLNERVRQTQYARIVGAAVRRGDVIAPVEDASAKGALWRCEWLAGRRHVPLHVPPLSPRRIPPRGRAAAASGTGPTGPGRVSSLAHVVVTHRHPHTTIIKQPPRLGPMLSGKPHGTSTQAPGKNDEPINASFSATTSSSSSFDEAAAPWEVQLRRSHGRACVEAHGVDLPCEYHHINAPPGQGGGGRARGAAEHGSCTLRATEAKAACERHPLCVGLMYSTDGRLATLKFRHAWMESQPAEARGWHAVGAHEPAHEAELSPSSTLESSGGGLENEEDLPELELQRRRRRSPRSHMSSSATSAPPPPPPPPLPSPPNGLRECIETTAAIARHARRTRDCHVAATTVWMGLKCERFVSNGRYGGSAMHRPPRCTPAAPLPCTRADDLKRMRGTGHGGSRRDGGCLVVLLRGHAFRLGGQFTESTTESAAMVASQERTLRTIREHVLQPLATATKESQARPPGRPSTSRSRTPTPRRADGTDADDGLRRQSGGSGAWRVPVILVDATHSSRLEARWRAMCEAVFEGWQVTVRPLGNRSAMLFSARGGSHRRRRHHGRTSQAASLRSSWIWATRLLLTGGGGGSETGAGGGVDQGRLEGEAEQRGGFGGGGGGGGGGFGGGGGGFGGGGGGGGSGGGVPTEGALSGRAAVSSAWAASPPSAAEVVGDADGIARVRGRVCWDAMLVLRVDIAFKQTLPLPLPWTAAASAFHVPHPAPSCGGLSATPGGLKRVGDSFFYVPRDLHERTGYAFEAKDELYLKAIALHDLADWLPADRMRSWMTGRYESNTAIASNPLFFQTGRDAAKETATTPCAPRPDSIRWGADGLAVWKAQMATRGGGGKLVGSFEFLPE